MTRYEKIRNLGSDPKPPITGEGEFVWRSESDEFWLVRESESGEDLSGYFYTFSAVEEEKN